jgi:cystinosin
VLNVLGFACYTQFNMSLFLSQHVQQEYMGRFGTRDIPVELNDVLFGLHALIMSSVLAVQCLVYPKHDTQAVALSTSISIGAALATAGGLVVALAVTGESRLPYTWLDL